MMYLLYVISLSPRAALSSVIALFTVSLMVRTVGQAIAANMHTHTFGPHETKWMLRISRDIADHMMRQGVFVQCQINRCINNCAVEILANAVAITLLDIRLA